MTTKNYCTLLIITIGVGLYAYSRVSCVTGNRNQHLENSNNMSRQSTEYANQGWMEDTIPKPGTAADIPFINTRKQIDELITDPQNLFAELANYKFLAQESPADAKAQFGWAYSAFLASNYEAAPPPRTPKLLDDIYLSLGVPANPHSFEYSRLHFLIGYLNSAGIARKEMTEYGIKFLDMASQKDFDLRYMAISSYANTLGMKHQQPVDKCLNLATTLHKDFPERYIVLDLLGRLYSDKFFFVEDAKYADKSIKCYQQIITMVPAKYGQWKSYAKRQIALSEKYKNRLKTTGKL